MSNQQEKTTESKYPHCYICGKNEFCYCSNCPYCPYKQCNFRRTGECVKVKDAQVAENNPAPG